MSTGQLRREAAACGIDDVGRWHAINEMVETDKIAAVKVRRLIEWAIGSRTSENDEDLPELVRQTQVAVNSLALMILCQGYLAKYAMTVSLKRGGHTEGCEAIATALRRMGWVEMVDVDNSTHIVSRRDSYPEVQLSCVEYWSVPFQGGMSLRARLKSELGTAQAVLPESVLELVEAIEKNNVLDEVFASAVARAYSELSQLLESA
jgi:hypothetical protein